MKKTIILLIFCALLLTGCLSKEDKQKKKEYEKEAKDIAKDFVDRKYGIDAKVVSSKAETETIEFSTYLTRNVYVEMKYNNKKFYVKVPIDKPKETIGDTYQNKEIEKDYIKYITKVFGKEPDYYDISYSSNRTSEMDYFEDKYDSNSKIDEFSPGSSKIYYINYNKFNRFDKELLKDVIQEDVVGYVKTISIYNLTNKKAYSLINKHNDFGYEEYILAKIDSISGKDYTTYIYDYELEDDIVLVGVKKEIKNSVTIYNCYDINNYSVSDETRTDLLNYDHSGMDYNFIQLSDVYTINEPLYGVYIKKSKYDKNDNISIAYKVTYDDGSERYSKENATRNNKSNYYFFSTSFHSLDNTRKVDKIELIIRKTK